MPKLTKEFIEGIQQIPVEELQRFVINAARKDKALFDLLNLEYLKKEDATEELFEATNDKITGHLINVSLILKSCIPIQTILTWFLHYRKRYNN